MNVSGELNYGAHNVLCSDFYTTRAPWVSEMFVDSFFDSYQSFVLWMQSLMFLLCEISICSWQIFLYFIKQLIRLYVLNALSALFLTLRCLITCFPALASCTLYMLASRSVSNTLHLLQLLDLIHLLLCLNAERIIYF